MPTGKEPTVFFTSGLGVSRSDSSLISGGNSSTRVTGPLAGSRVSAGVQRKSTRSGPVGVAAAPGPGGGVGTGAGGSVGIVLAPGGGAGGGATGAPGPGATTAPVGGVKTAP